jgi:hypothetical protein
VTLGTHRWTHGGWLKTLAVLALALGGTVAPALATATSTQASTTPASTSPYQLTGGLPAGAKMMDDGGLTPRNAFGGHVAHGIPNLDTIPNFSGHFNVKGLNGAGQSQNQWLTNFVGTPPQHGGTTTINAPIIPVTVQLLDQNGQTVLSSSASQYESNVTNSPVFSPATWSSSTTPTELPDAIQRAEFFQSAKADWHTELNPVQTPSFAVQIPFGEYFFQLNSDGTCCRFILVNSSAFDDALSGAVSDAINSGTITTQDISTFLFPNTYLFINSLQNCCVLGFHTYFFNDLSTGIEQRWVLNYSSWISPGLFQGGLQDVTALSHEMAETFADPFVVSDGTHGLTPWWLSPNGNCQNDMEVGDVIENLPDGVFPVTLNGFTYHPQNIALMQWFDTGQPSNALDGAFSYPNESVLTSPATSQNVNCSP